MPRRGLTDSLNIPLQMQKLVKSEFEGAKALIHCGGISCAGFRRRDVLPPLQEVFGFLPRLLMNFHQ